MDSAHFDRITARLSRRRAFQAGAALTAAVVAPRLPAAAAPASQGATPAATPAGAVTPDRVARAVAGVPALARNILAQSGVPGMAVAIVSGDQVVYLGGFGVRELGKPAPIDPDTVFQLASVSKSLAATVVSAVVGDGHLSWDARMADVAPGFALHDAWPTQNVTLADLFSHRSGLRDHAGDLLEDLGFSADEVIHRLRYLEPEYSFRAGYAYTNFGLSAAAYAVAQSVGTPWADLSAQRLYRPLGMAHTSSRFSDYMAQANRAIPHVKIGGKWQVTPMQRDPDAQSPAGGVSSTARDLAQWVRLQLAGGMYAGQRVVAAAGLAPMHWPQAVLQEPADPATQRAGFYGLGVNVSYPENTTVQWSHSGAFDSGAATAYYLLPASKFGVLALTNAAPVGAPEALCVSVLDLAQLGAVSRDWLALFGPALASAVAPNYGTELKAAPTAPAPALPNAVYTGTYQNDYYGTAQIAAAGPGLVLRLGPKPLEFALTHFDRDTFTWQPEGENAYGRSALTFSVDATGKASAFTDDYLASGGAGTLTRTS